LLLNVTVKEDRKIK